MKVEIVFVYFFFSIFTCVVYNFGSIRFFKNVF